MEFPFDYTLFYLVSILDNRNKKLEINKKNLLLIFKNLIDLLPYDEEEKREINEDFNFNYEFNSFINLYSEYLDIDDNYIIFDIDRDDLNDILSSIKCDYSEYLLDDISSTIDCNFVFLDLLGIKIRKDIYNKLFEIENEVEIIYDNLYRNNNDEEFMRQLKNLIFKRKIILNYIESNFSSDQYYDLYIYASNMAIDNDDELPISFEFVDDTFDENELLQNPMFKAIFYKERLSSYNIARRMDVNISRTSGMYQIDILPELKFYLNFLNFLDKEMSNVRDKNLLDEFIASKYRLMNALDTVYDTYTFIDDKDYIEINNINSVLDYSFIEDKVFCFIEQMLHYNDDMYRYDDKEFYNLVNYYFNTIKMLLIKTYYHLTNDDRVKDKIKNNPLYGVNKISTSLLNSAIEKNDVKTKIRRTD